MMRLLQRSQPVLFVLVAPWIASSATALASTSGGVAAALVLEASYRHFLDDMLYTHDGDDRCWGPEHDLARDNIVAILAGYGLDVVLEPFPYLSDTYHNVVATKWGTIYPNQEYIIGSHFDSINEAGGNGAPGAGDNATGVALLLEAARVLSEYDSDYTIRFIAFDRHEQGVFGSSAYVAAHAGDTILGVIAPDMIASGGSQEVIVHARPASYTFRDAVGDAITTYGQDLFPALQSDFSPCLNDHCPFQDAGIPGCRLLEYLYMSNPYDHTSEDSVDTPDYIDYAYGTKITQSIVGFLVDHAGVQVTLPNADFDGDGDVDMDDWAELELCYTGSGIPVDPPCDFFDLDGDGDVDCTDLAVFKAVWTGPGDPPIFWPCNLLAPESVEAQGGRALVVTPPEHGMPMALLVEGDPEDPNVSCMSLAEGQRYYIQPGGGIVRTDEPEYQMYDAWGTVVVTGYEIVPETYYRVWCDYGPAGLSSTGVYATSGRWGDAVGDFVGGEWTPPDDDVDFMDIYAIVEAFRHLPTAPPVLWVDLVGQSGNECTPDAAIDFLDISAAVEAFKGNSYWESMPWCPAPCE